MNEPTDADWAALRATAEALPPDVRKAAADHWSRTAQLEHASIASFARFSLDLLAVAAPPKLIDGSHRAGLDELRHAKLTFKLASIYAGAPLGPGPLPVDARAFEGRGFEQIVCSAVVEGCIGESLSAFEAIIAENRAQPPAVKAVLGIIAEEEGAHAELAFMFVAWALAHDGSVAATAKRVADVQLEAMFAEPVPREDSAWALTAHGALSGTERVAQRRLTITESIRPALDRLFSR